MISLHSLYFLLRGPNANKLTWVINYMFGHLGWISLWIVFLSNPFPPCVTESAHAEGEACDCYRLRLNDKMACQNSIQPGLSTGSRGLRCLCSGLGGRERRGQGLLWGKAGIEDSGTGLVDCILQCIMVGIFGLYINSINTFSSPVYFNVSNEYC